MGRGETGRDGTGRGGVEAGPSHSREGILAMAILVKIDVTFTDKAVSFYQILKGVT